MVRLRDGTSFTRWQRWLTALSPDAPPRTLDTKWTGAIAAALAGEPLDASFAQTAFELCAEGEPTSEADPELLARLVDLDTQYLGWWADMADTDGRLASIEAMHARRRLFEPPGASRPTLPASTLFRALTIESLSPDKVLLLGDADGLGLALSGPEVTAVVPGALTRDWLSAEAQRAQSRTELLESPPDDGGFDVAVADVGTASETRDILSTALAATRPGGHVLLALRYPLESSVYPLLETSGLAIERYLRDVNHYLLPGGHALDGGGDLLVLNRGHGTLPASEPHIAADLRAQPYALIELERLARDRLNSGAIDRFVHAVESFAPRPKEMRDSIRGSNHDVLWWFDIEGYGFSVELRHDHAHMAIVLAPYDPALEYVVLCSAFWTLGDSMTRTYPLRTRRTRSGEVMA